MPTEERKPFLLRIPPDLWKELEKWAGDELRSVNGQIEYLLRQAVEKRKRTQAEEKEDQPGVPLDFAPMLPLPCRRTEMAPASMSRPPMTSRSRRREEAGNIHSSSALEIFALNGVALKSESTRTMFARSSATMGLA
jgi:hypothetical protein